jgi:hypothetical protein
VPRMPRGREADFSLADESAAGPIFQVRPPISGLALGERKAIGVYAVSIVQDSIPAGQLTRRTLFASTAWRVGSGVLSGTAGSQRTLHVVPDCRDIGEARCNLWGPPRCAATYRAM